MWWCRVILCFVCFALSATTIGYAAGVKTHTCAPSIPPAVAGSLVQPQPLTGALVINEVLLNPHSLWNCSSTQIGTADIWIELYNPQGQALDLYGAHAMLDSGPGSHPFYLPFGSAIAAHSFLVVFPLTNDQGPALVAGSAVTVRLLLADVPVDQVVVPPLASDTSYARVPDGSASWLTTANPTIDASNTLPAPARTATPRATRTPETQRAVATRTVSGAGDGTATWTGTTSGASQGDVQATAVQTTPAAWRTLQFPTSTPPAATGVVATAVPLSLASTAPTPAPPGTLQKLLLTLVAIGLLVALFWCWKLFVVSRRR